jgi:signal peptidase II
MKPWRAENYKLAALAVAIFLADQLSKLWIVSNLKIHASWKVIPGFFSLTYIQNTGAAWGLFREYPQALAVLASITLIVLILFAPSFQSGNNWTRWGWLLLVGGIAGNLADRIRLGGVIDFLDFYAGGRHWPAFNIADSAICAGVICYIIDSFCRKHRAPCPQELEKAAG